MFKVAHCEDVTSQDVDEKGARGVRIRWLISKEDGASNFAMRYFEIEPGGETPYHSHSWEHEVFILEGKGVVVCNGTEKEISPRYVVFIPPNAQHSFKNKGTSLLSFLCLIPYGKGG
jgi:quercetin dioxygenase-like cupin family protein